MVAGQDSDGGVGVGQTGDQVVVKAAQRVTLLLQQTPPVKKVNTCNGHKIQSATRCM